jgi:hypothetical protein
MPHPGLFLCFSLLMLALALPALAVMSDSESPRQVSNDPDYAAGLAAFQRADWQNVLGTIARVVARRPTVWVLSLCLTEGAQGFRMVKGIGEPQPLIKIALRQGAGRGHGVGEVP